MHEVNEHHFSNRIFLLGGKIAVRGRCHIYLNIIAFSILSLYRILNTFKGKVFHCYSNILRNIKVSFISLD